MTGVFFAIDANTKIFAGVWSNPMALHPPFFKD
jgi:hypothetical protein